MIASQKIGKSFMGALRYNWNKLFHPDPALRAQLLYTNFESMDLKMIRREVEIVQSLRPALNWYVYHTSLNFSSEDVLDNQTALEIAQRYLTEMGYTGNQCMIFRHHDAGHPHLHLLANRISFDGTVVSDSNNYKKSEATLRKLEKEYDLAVVEQSSYKAIESNSHRAKVLDSSTGAAIQSNNATGVDSYIAVKQSNQVGDRAPVKDEVEMAIRTGSPSQKMVMQEKLSHVIDARSGIQLDEFIHRCEEKGIHLLFN